MIFGQEFVSTEATTNTDAAKARLGEERMVDDAGRLRLGNETMGILRGAGMNLLLRDDSGDWVILETMSLLPS